MKTGRRPIAALIAALTMSPALADAPPSAPEAGQVVRVTLVTFATRLSTKALHSGEVTFIVTNDAPDLTHEFFLVQTQLSPQDLPLDAEGRIEEESPRIHKIVSIEDLRPGQQGQATVHLDAGHYVYFCNINFHHLVGMRGELTVKP